MPRAARAEQSGSSHMIVPAAPPHTIELAASPRMDRTPSPEGAAEAGLPGTTLRSACMADLLSACRCQDYPCSPPCLGIRSCTCRADRL